jgi:ABC-type polysaccharide/polyol phosphate export permease
MPAASVRSSTGSRGPWSLLKAGIRDLSTRSNLIRYLVSADMKRTHADSVIGNVWWLLDPILQMAVYLIVFGFIFKRSTPDFPLFLFACVLPWKWFSTSLNDGTLSVVSRQALIRQLPFPKLVLPVSSAITGSISFLWGLLALGIVYLAFLDRLSIWVLALPLIALVQLVFTLAAVILASALNAFFRDIQNVLTHGTRLWWYLSPGLWSLTEISNPNFRFILRLNPFTTLFEAYRSVTWGTSAPDWGALAAVLVASLVLLGIAIVIFKKVEPAFARIL